MRIGGREFDTATNTYVMGILNVTPDSFSDGGKYGSLDDVLYHAQRMVEEGADILDVGGESTRPGYRPVSEQEEIERVVPVLEAIGRRIEVPLSLDTWKANVARAGIAAGAHMINDIWGLKKDAQMAEVIAKSGIPCCLMHNRKEAVYQDFMQEVAADLAQSLHLAEAAGIAADKIILDPGVGFGKSYENNLEVIGCLEELKVLGCPILLGASRKSVIGLTLDVPVEERLEGTLVTTVFGVLKGCSFVRVHDIRENVRAIRMARALLGR